MTTTPWRINDIEPVLQSLLNQTLTPTTINIYVPYFCARKNEPYVIPDWLTEFINSNFVIKIVRVEKDFGSATKLIPSLDRYKDFPSNTRFITVDDDIIYEPHTLEELVKASEVDPESVYCMMGIDSKKCFMHAEWVELLQQPRWKVDILGGYRGVIYPKKVFEDGSILEDLKEVMNITNPFLADDHLFSWNLFRRDIPVYVTRSIFPKCYPTIGNISCVNCGFLNLAEPISVGTINYSLESEQILLDYYNKMGYKHPS